MIPSRARTAVASLVAVAAVGTSALTASAGASPAAATRIPTITQSASGLTVQLAKGAELRVNLVTVVDGDYLWYYTHKPAARVVTVVSKKLVPASSSGHTVGAPAHTVYLLKAAGAGTTTLRLVQKQPETKVDESHFRLTIVVK